MATFDVPKFTFPEPTEEQIAQLKTHFEALDKDHNGKLDKNEMTEALKAQNFPVDRVDMIFALGDKDHDGTLDFNEFVDALKTIGKAIVDAKNAAIEMFKKLDVDHNGALDEDEIFNSMNLISGGKATREQAKAVIAEKDKDGDGKITLEEFLQSLRFH